MLSTEHVFVIVELPHPLCQYNICFFDADILTMTSTSHMSASQLQSLLSSTLVDTGIGLAELCVTGFRLLERPSQNHRSLPLPIA